MFGQPVPSQPLPPESTEFTPLPPESRPVIGRGRKISPFRGLLGKRRRGYLLAQQMQRLMGQRVQVATFSGKLDGEVAGVYPDNFLVTKEGQRYYIRWDAIAYVTPVEEL
jgi:Protein of unknown function (DUF2642)